MKSSHFPATALALGLLAYAQPAASAQSDITRGSFDMAVVQGGLTTTRTLKLGEGPGDNLQDETIGIFGPGDRVEISDAYLLAAVAPGARITAARAVITVNLVGLNFPITESVPFAFRADCSNGLWRTAVASCDSGDQEWGQGPDALSFSPATELAAIGFTSGDIELGVTWLLTTQTGSTTADVVLGPATARGSVDQSLPVSLASFTLAVEGADVALAWSTASEVDNRGFTVERSGDAELWATVGFVPGAGTTDAAQAYTFTDAPPASGDWYYRLRQEDRDGTAATSATLVAQLGDAAAPLTVGPNPAHGSTYVTLGPAQTPGTQVEARLVDAAGRTVRVLALRPGTRERVDLAGLPTGSYSVLTPAGGARLEIL